MTAVATRYAYGTAQAHGSWTRKVHQRKMLAHQRRWRGAWSPDLRSAKWEDVHRSQGRREEEEEGHKGQAQSADNVSFSLSLGLNNLEQTKF